MRAYALDSISNAQKPSENTDIDAIRARCGISPYADLKLYIGYIDIQPLKPHQAADKWPRCLISLDLLSKYFFWLNV